MTLIKKRLFILFIILTGSLTNGIYGQCDLACEGLVSISFNGSEPDCEVIIEPATLLRNEETTCDPEDLEVHIMSADGRETLNKTGAIDIAFIGSKLQFKVYNPTSGNSCWGELEIKDEDPPELICPDETEVLISCIDAIEDYIADNFEVAESECGESRVEESRSISNANRCDGTYGDEVLEIITKGIIAIDENGNKSAECEITFLITRLPSLEGDIIYPPSFNGTDEDPLSCGNNIPSDERGMGFPSPIEKNGIPGTGVPTLDGEPIFPNSPQHCNLWVDYVDTPVKDGCKKEFIRTWVVQEVACTQEGAARVYEFPQNIIIKDDQAPLIQKLPDMKFSTSPTVCGRTLPLTTPQITEVCGENFTLDVQIEGGKPLYIPDFSSGMEIELDTGMNNIIFIARDACGNESRDTVAAQVSDDTAPATVCKTFIVASLNNEGIAKVYASSVDNGSKDECYVLKSMKVKRMDNGAECEDEDEERDADGFSDYVAFCCDDVGEPVMVLLQTKDKEGNIGECMVEVEVQDKYDPFITCPPDLTLSCGAPLDNLSLYGKIGEGYDDREEFEISDDFLINASGPLIDGYAVDNCDYDIRENVEDNLNSCMVGTIVRTFTVEDDSGRTSTCTQTITIERSVEMKDAMPIEWPADTMIIGCFTPDDPFLSPENLGKPIIEEDHCRMIGMSRNDEVYRFGSSSDGACHKILRNWKIIDWCAVDNESSRSDFSHIQVIKLLDTIPPEFIGTYPDTVICSNDETCMSGDINLLAIAEDASCGNLIGYYEIDLNRTGVFEITSDKVENDSILVNTIVEIGDHLVRYYFSDQCGNTVKRDQLFSVVNCKAATPYAYSGLVIDLMGVDTTGDGRINTGMIEVWANDFDAGSSGPCDAEIIFSFSPDTADRARTFTCDDVGMQDLELYVSYINEQGEIIQNYANTSLDVQDNMKLCEDDVRTFTQGIVGNLTSTANMVIPGAVIKLEGSTAEVKTNQSGYYAFDPMPSGGNYQVIPYKNEDALLGVNTLDLVKIQRHILGVKEFESPEQFVASDINNDGLLTAADLISLRKLVLGIDKSFKQNTSWRFVDSKFDWPQNEVVLETGWPETYAISNLQSDMEIDFTAIKIGDVDDDHHDGLRGINTRSGGTAELIAHIEPISKSNYWVHFRLNESQSILGLQLNVDLPSTLQVVQVEGHKLSLEKENYYINDNNNMKYSYNSAQPLSLSRKDRLLSIKVADYGSQKSWREMAIATGLKSQIYDSNENSLHLDLRFETEQTYLLEQNTPNPFTDYTTVAFTLPYHQQISLTVFDVTGKTVYRINQTLPAGNHQIRLDRADIRSSGVLYYRLNAEGYTETKKMLLVR